MTDTILVTGGAGYVGSHVVVELAKVGYAPVVLCRACGQTVQCENCAIALTHHKRDHRLECHYCGFKRAVPKLCPKCQSEHIYFIGAGSEKLEDRLHGLPGRRPMSQALGREADHFGAGVRIVRKPTDAAQGFELVHDLHHGLLRDHGAVGQLREARARPVHQEEGGRLAGAKVRDAPVLKTPPDLGVERAEGREQQVGKIRLRHGLRW